MLRRLAVACLAFLPLLAACGQTSLLTVGTGQITVEPNDLAAYEDGSIPYSLGVPAHVTITLVQPDGARVVLRDNDRAAESYAFPFTGVISVPDTDDQRVLSDGDYKLLFQATTPAGQSAQQAVDAIVRNADPVPLDITDIQLSLPQFSPNGQGIREIDGRIENLDQTTINYSLSKDADVTIWVVDQNGQITPVTTQPSSKQGLQSFTWDGKGPNGLAIKNGTYTLHIHAEDQSGNVTDRTTTVTIVDSGTPQVQILSAKFFPTVVPIGGEVNVVVTIKNIGDVAIKTQGPPPGTSYTSRSSYSDPSFNRPGDSEPPYVDKPGRWRIGVRWTSSAAQYPVRWGFFSDDNRELQPGEQVTVQGKVQLLAPQPPTLDFVAVVEMGGIGFSDEYGRTHVTVAK